MKIPEHRYVYKKIGLGKKLNPLEEFVFQNEPAGSEDEAWRQSLSDMLDFVLDKETK